MKTIILSAGLGTRLKPLTDHLPKVMLPVKGKPLLEHHLANLREYGLTDIGINLHYLPHVIRDHFGNGQKFGVHIHYSYEKTLLGTAGAINNFRQWLGDDHFLVIYGDIFCHLPYQALLDTFKEHPDSLGLIGLKHSDVLKGKGLVKVNNRGQITNFIEKPPLPKTYKTDLISIGVYVFNNKILDFLPTEGKLDFGYDIFPNLIPGRNSLFGYIINEPLIDIGTRQTYAKVNKIDCYK